MHMRIQIRYCMQTMEHAGPFPTSGRPKRVLLATLMAVVAMNVWIGGPLLALWIGSRVQAHAASSLTISPLTAVVVFASLAAISIALVRLMGIIGARYDRATGAGPQKRRHDSWVSAERMHAATALTVLERILVVVVVIAALTFEIWFFFF